MTPGATYSLPLPLGAGADCQIDRRQGLARRLTETAIEWCRANAIATVILHASDEGRDLYSSLGFQPTNEMRRTV